MVKVGNEVEPSGTGWYPESKNFSNAEVWDNGTQGAVKELAVTVWFLARNSKVMVSPAFALMFEGLKVRPPAPTRTLWSVPAPAVDDGDDEVDVPVELGDPVELEDAVLEGAAPVAAALKVANFSAEPGLMAKTIPPVEQCVPCAQ